MKYIHKQIEVEAEQWLDPNVFPEFLESIEKVKSSGDNIIVRGKTYDNKTFWLGDWRVVYPDSRVFYMSDREFQESYDLQSD